MYPRGAGSVGSTSAACAMRKSAKVKAESNKLKAKSCKLKAGVLMLFTLSFRLSASSADGFRCRQRTVDEINQPLDFVQIGAKNFVDAVGPMRRSEPDHEQVANGRKGLAEVALELIEHLEITGAGLAPLQADEVAHDDDEGLGGVEHQAFQPFAIGANFGVQGAQAQQFAPGFMLRLIAQVAAIELQAQEDLFAVKHTMELLDVLEFHRE